MAEACTIAEQIELATIVGFVFVKVVERKARG